MARPKQMGQWARLFGRKIAFHEEARKAAEIGAAWERDHGQRDIVLDEIPGWLAPLWGVHGDWLYIRRPEGVWKTRIPLGFSHDDVSLIRIHQRAPKTAGAIHTLGGTVIGRSLQSHGGWIQGNAIGKPMDAWEMDERASPAARGFDVEADAVGSAWGALASSEEGRLVVDGGDYFAKPPSFRLVDDWLMASDAETGRTVAFAMHGYAAYAEALKTGKLWLRFESMWLRSFDAQVMLAS